MKMPSSEDSISKQGIEEEYEVEEVMGVRLVQGKKQYLLKWKDYPHSENTWEWEENLQCPELLNKFRLQHKKLLDHRKTRSIKISPLNPKAYLGPNPIGRENFSKYKGPYEYMYIQCKLQNRQFCSSF